MDGIVVRSAPSAWKVLVAAAVALATCVQLALAAGTHDVAEHARGGDDHACVICTFSHAREVGPAVLAEIVAPRTGEALRPADEPTPHTPAVVVPHPARGPPAPRA